MKHLHLFLLALALLLAGCSSGPRDDDDSSADDDDDSSGDDDDSSGDDDDDATDDDDSSDDDDDDSAGSSGLEVSGEEASCGPEPEPLPPENLLLNVTGPGAISVLQFNHSVGCCPDLTVSAALDAAAATISIGYSLSPDLCDCICGLDYGFNLSGIPAGFWTLDLPGGVDRGFTVQ
jgi:hypothetical protein